MLIQKLLPSWIYRRIFTLWGKEGMQRYGTNTLSLLMVRVFSALISLFVTIYLTRYLGPTNYGQLSYAVSFVGLFAIIGSLGIDNVLYRELIQHPHKQNIYLGSAFAIKFFAGCLATLIVAAVAFVFVADDVSRIVILILAGTFMFNASNVIIYEFQAHVEQKRLAFVSIAVVIVLNVLKLFVIFLQQGIIYIAFVLLLESVLYACVFAYMRTRHYGSLRAWRYDAAVATTILRDSWPFIFIAVFASIYARIDQVMLKHLIDSSAVGLYDAAVRIAEAWLFVPAIIASSLLPAIINGRKTSPREYKKRLVYLIGLLGIGAVIIAIPASLAASPLMQLLYGTAFVDSAPVFAVYIWSGVFIAMSAALQYFLLAERLHKTIFFTSCGTMLLNVALNFLLIPSYGIVGAAWATLISYAVLVLPIILIIRLSHE